MGFESPQRDFFEAGESVDEKKRMLELFVERAKSEGPRFNFEDLLTKVLNQEGYKEDMVLRSKMSQYIRNNFKMEMLNN